MNNAERDALKAFILAAIRAEVARSAASLGKSLAVAEKGERGEPGPQGEPGRDGASGKDGRDGIDGKNGAAGRDGADGAPGRDGKDAVGIEAASVDDGGVLVLRFTDGTQKAVGRVVGPEGKRGDPGVDGRDGVDGVPGEKGLDGRDGRDGKDGSPGRDGTKGDPGRDGKDGADGVGPDEIHAAVAEGLAKALESMRIEDRTLIIGQRTIAIPMMIYRGVWSEGGPYERGDCVTLAGSLWHCNATTTDRPGDGQTAWTLAAKKGRDGRDARA